MLYTGEAEELLFKATCTLQTLEPTRAVMWLNLEAKPPLLQTHPDAEGVSQRLQAKEASFHSWDRSARLWVQSSCLVSY